MLREARGRALARRAQAITDELIAQARKRTTAANESNQCLVVLEGTHLFVAVLVNWDARRWKS
jgi:hypothetical protein